MDIVKVCKEHGYYCERLFVGHLLHADGENGTVATCTITVSDAETEAIITEWIADEG